MTESSTSDRPVAEAADRMREYARQSNSRVQHAATRLTENVQRAIDNAGRDTYAYWGSLTAEGVPGYGAIKGATDHVRATARARMWTKVRERAAKIDGDEDQALITAAGIEVDHWLDLHQRGNTFTGEDAIKTAYRQADLDGQWQFIRDVRETDAWLRSTHPK